MYSSICLWRSTYSIEVKKTGRWACRTQNFLSEDVSVNITWKSTRGWAKTPGQWGASQRILMSLQENKLELVTSCWRLHPQLGQVKAFLLHLGSAKCQKSKGGLRVPQKNPASCQPFGPVMFCQHCRIGQVPSGPVNSTHLPLMDW